MRPIHLVQLDKIRPALILTRPTASARLAHLTIAPIRSRARGLNVELPVGPENGLRHASVVNLESVQTVPRSDVLQRIGFLLPEQEPALADVLAYTFDLWEP